jgi:hypothetical protein
MLSAFSLFNLCNLEGGFYQTEQIYTLFLYESPMGARCDRLIGYAKVNSSQLN